MRFSSLSFSSFIIVVVVNKLIYDDDDDDKKKRKKTIRSINQMQLYMHEEGRAIFTLFYACIFIYNIHV